VVVEIIRQEIFIKVINNKEPVHNVLQPIQPDHIIVLYSQGEDGKTQSEIIV